MRFQVQVRRLREGERWRRLSANPSVGLIENPAVSGPSGWATPKGCRFKPFRRRSRGAAGERRASIRMVVAVRPLTVRTTCDSPGARALMISVTRRDCVKENREGFAQAGAQAVAESRG